MLFFPFNCLPLFESTLRLKATVDRCLHKLIRIPSYQVRFATQWGSQKIMIPKKWGTQKNNDSKEMRNPKKIMIPKKWGFQKKLWFQTNEGPKQIMTPNQWGTQTNNDSKPMRNLNTVAEDPKPMRNLNTVAEDPKPMRISNCKKLRNKFSFRDLFCCCSC